MLHLLVAVLDPDAGATAVGVVRALRAAMPSLDVSRLGGVALAREDTRDITAPGSLEAGVRRTPVDAALVIGGGRWQQARLARRLRRLQVAVAVMAGEASVQWPWAASRLAASSDLVIASPVVDVEDIAATGIGVARVGHPLADDVTLPLAGDRSEARRGLGLSEDPPVVALCAGRAGLPALAPLVRDALWRGRSGERLQLAVGVADDAEVALARRVFGAAGQVVPTGRPRLVLTAADVAVCGDGESTLLAALLGTPLLLARRRGWRERTARALAPGLGGHLAAFDAWPNRVLCARAVPELLDGDCRAPRIASEVAALVEHAADQAQSLAAVRKAVRAERTWAAIARLLVDLAVGGGAPGQPPIVKRSS